MNEPTLADLAALQAENAAMAREIAMAKLAHRNEAKNAIAAEARAEMTLDRVRRAEARADRLAKALVEIETFAKDEARVNAWDSWRKYIANGGGGSWPRDAYESFLDFVSETARAALAEEPKT